MKQLRISKNLNQTELSDALNERFNLKTDRVMVSKWETGFQTPMIHTIACMAKFFNVSIDYLNGDINDSSPYSHLETLTVYSFEGKNGLGTAEQELDLTKLKPLRKLHDAASKLTPEQIERLADLAKDMK